MSSTLRLFISIPSQAKQLDNNCETLLLAHLVSLFLCFNLYQLSILICLYCLQEFNGVHKTTVTGKAETQSTYFLNFINIEVSLNAFCGSAH